MQKITPFLWFDNQAEEAATFYTSIFPQAKILEIVRYSDAGPGKPGSVMTVSFYLNDSEYVAFNGGPSFKFSEAVSLCVRCETQTEIDLLWEKLSEGGSKLQCGWLKDQYGVFWQILPAMLGELLRDRRPQKAASVTQALMQMQKIDIATLRTAYDTA